MFSWFGMRVRRGVGILAMALLAVLLPAGPALAHCDSVNGPVVTAARQALAQNDVKLILPYIKAADETELTAAFSKAREAMAQGGKGAELAELWFAETAVRLHRQGEGEPYTGLKYETDYGPALEAAEQAVETGNLNKVTAVLTDAIKGELAAKYQVILETRERAAKEGTVEAKREAVEAELMFEVYVHELGETIKGGEPHGEAALVPLRAVAEAVGATVSWDEHERAAVVKLGQAQFEVRPGTGGAVLQDGRTMVPAQFLLARLGLLG